MSSNHERQDSSALKRLSAVISKPRVSIDQCFLSDMCNEDGRSQDLLAAINQAHAAGRIICPIHVEESLRESAALPAPMRARIFALQNRLSNGFAFLGLARAIYDSTRALLDPAVLVPPIYEEVLEPGPAEVFERMAAEHAEQQRDYVARVEAIAYPPAGYEKGMTGEELALCIGDERASSMGRILESLRDGRGLITDRATEWEVAIRIGSLLLRDGIGPAACEFLLEKIKERTWSSIPCLWAHTRINAQLEFGYLAGMKKANPNDLFDLSRIAVALEYGSVLLCDKAMAELIWQSKVTEVLSGVAVFSMQERGAAAAHLAKM